MLQNDSTIVFNCFAYLGCKSLLDSLYIQKMFSLAGQLLYKTYSFEKQYLTSFLCFFSCFPIKITYFKSHSLSNILFDCCNSYCSNNHLTVKNFYLPALFVLYNPIVLVYTSNHHIN